MFLVCEPIAWGLEHVPFNASLLKTIRFAFPNDAICFYGEESHLKHVRKYIGAEFATSIIWRTLILPPRHSSFFNRMPSDFKLVRFLLSQLNKNPISHVLVIMGNSSLLWALKFFISTIHKNKKVQVIFHGILASLGNRGSLKPFTRISDIRTALKMFSRRCIQYLVLEEPIRDAVLKELPFLHNRIGVLDHPIPLDEQPTEANNFNPPIQFGFLGFATKHKGFLKYLSVASDISKRFPGLANFHVIGRVNNQYKYLNIPEMAFLKSKAGTERLSREEYVERLNKLHFVCLFCEDRHYEFSASGVLLDSIAWQKPIIATQLPIFENLEHRFGDIGYLCKHDEFSETIGTILRKIDSNRYNRQVLNVRQVKSSRTPESLARKYRELVKRSHIK